jgi:hypothetical protein
MDTISEGYRAQQVELHTNPNYGVASLAFAPLVAKLAVDNGVKSISDYGAGKKHLQTALQGAGLDLTYYPYDPAFPEYGPPTEADMVCCIDVLEHIEPDRLDAVLDDLASIMPRLGFFSIHTGAAVKVLSDGRNAHLIQEPARWWLPRLCERRFHVHHLQHHQMMGQGFWVVVSRA